MAQVILKIEIDSGKWIIDLIRDKDDRIHELKWPKNEVRLRGIPEGKVFPVSIAISARKGTKFKVYANETILIDEKTNSDNMLTVYAWLHT